jgi:hypothetical protein
VVGGVIGADGVSCAKSAQLKARTIQANLIVCILLCRRSFVYRNHVCSSIVE